MWANSSCSCLQLNELHGSSVISIPCPRAVSDDHRPIQGIYRVKVQSGLPFSPKSSQSSLLLPCQAFGEARQSPQVQPGKDDSLPSAELSSSCVALRFSASWFPGAVAAVTPLTTQTLLCCRPHHFRSAEMNTKNGTCSNLHRRYNRRVYALWSKRIIRGQLTSLSLFFKTVC